MLVTLVFVNSLKMFVLVKATRSSYLPSLGHVSERCDADVAMHFEAHLIQFFAENRRKGEERRTKFYGSAWDASMGYEIRAKRHPSLLWATQTCTCASIQRAQRMGCFEVACFSYFLVNTLRSFVRDTFISSEVTRMLLPLFHWAGWLWGLSFLRPFLSTISNFSKYGLDRHCTFIDLETIA